MLQYSCRFVHSGDANKESAVDRFHSHPVAVGCVQRVRESLSLPTFNRINVAFVTTGY